MNNLPAVVFILLYIFLNYTLYKKAIYPGLIRNYHDGHIKNRGDFKKSILFSVSMVLGWFLLLGLWLLYLATFLIVALVGGDAIVSTVCLNIAGTSLLLSMVATGWPKPIGRFLLREK